MVCRRRLADQRHHLAGFQGEGEMAPPPSARRRIDEADILEHEAFTNRFGKGRGLAGNESPAGPRRRRRGRRDRAPGPPPRRSRSAAIRAGCAAAERAGQERQVTDREFAGQGAPGDVGVGEVVADRADRREQRAPAGAAQGEAAVGVVEGGGEPAIAIDQKSFRPKIFTSLAVSTLAAVWRR